MHPYLGLHSFLELHLMSPGCYPECFTWMSQFPNFRFKMKAKDPSAHIHNACCIPILFTLYPLLVESFLLTFLLRLAKFSRPLFVSRQTAFSFLLCLAHFFCPVLVGLANFFLSLLFFCLPTVVYVYKIAQRQTYHKKHNLCQVLH